MSALAFVAVGCIEEGLEPDTPSAGNGNDVQFGLSFDGSETRTIYGSETSTGFPIYWSQGDKVLVGSPQCAVTSAEYEVTPVSGQSYASAMNKTGDAGVQWGRETTAEFYSVYPSTGASWESLTESNVTAKLNIASEQSANIVFDQENLTYSAADMDNVIMYAYTKASRFDDKGNENAVNLKYKPYSTILEFELGIGPSGENKIYGSAKVLSMTLTAPDGTAIAGDFNLTFDEADVPTISKAGNNSNVITMEFTTQPVVKKDTSLKAKIAVIPLDNVTSLTGWTVSFVVIEGNEEAAKTYTKTLTPSEVNDKSDLVPGAIHKIKLPLLTPSAAWTYNTNNWVTALYDYKNIYLTELSVPGAWYAGAPTGHGYQKTASVSELWNAGVRAFAVECRSATSSLLSSTIDRVVVSGTGSNAREYGLFGDYTYYYEGTRISTLIENIADQVANSLITENDVVVDGEFAVLVLSYADGGGAGHRSQDYAYFINGIKTEIETAKVSNIYAGPVTANTTVADVLGKLIIKINVDDYLTIGSYKSDMDALLSYNPFVQQLPKDTVENADGTTTSFVDYTKIRFSKMYWETWTDSYKDFSSFNSTDFLWCFSSANRTQLNTGSNADLPTYSQRQAALRGMINHSKELTAAEGHNVWFYFNAGGTQTTSLTDVTDDDNGTNATNFATEMNSWLLDVIKLKANGGTDTAGVMGTAGSFIESDPSPLGIVMFNQCTNSTYYGPEIIKEIIEMNNKFKLLRATDNVDPDNPDEGEEEDPGV